jgi:CheY-like chemotaxis protein
MVRPAVRGPPVSKSHRGISVLFVDDDPDNRATISDFLPVWCRVELPRRAPTEVRAAIG